MKNCKLIFALLLITLCLATSVISAYAYVPSGKSGVNFARVEEGTKYALFTDHRLANEENIVYFPLTSYYNRATGGIGRQITETPYVTNVGDTYTIEIQLDGRPMPAEVAENYDGFLSHLNNSDAYYISALLLLRNVSTNQTTICELTTTRIEQGGTGMGFNAAGTDGFLKPSNYYLYDHLKLSFTNNDGAGTYHVAEVVGLQISQATQIYGYWQGNNPITSYIPYSDAYFNESDEQNEAYENGFIDGQNSGRQIWYQNGYNDGYIDGAEDSGGEPIQRWGAFLLTGITGFLSFEVYPGFPLWGLLASIIAVPLVLAFLKMFAGG